MKKIIYALVFILAFAGCSEVELSTDMFNLEKAFIRVWQPSQIGHWKASQDAFPGFSEEWNSFYKKYKYLLKTEDEVEVARLMKQWIEGAELCFDQNDALCVQVKLDQFKFELQEIRSYWKADYYLDYIWDFEEQLFRLVEQIKEPHASEITKEDIMGYQKALNRAFERWDEKELDTEMLNDDFGDISKFLDYQSDLKVRMQCLNSLTEATPVSEIIDCAERIQGITYEILALVGKTTFKNELI